MSINIPDKWALVECITPDSYTIKVLATWYGGYAGSDYWKLSSGIVGLEPIDGSQIHRLKDDFRKEDGFVFPNLSGSTYICLDRAYGLSMYGYSIFENLKAIEMPHGWSFELMNIDLV
jgi:hypothetical protein